MTATDHSRSQYHVKSAEQYILRCSPTNRGYLRRCFLQRLNRNVAPGTLKSWANAVLRADQWANGQDLRTLDADDWTAFLVSLRTSGYAPATIYTTAGYVKSALREALPDEDIPRATKRALSVREPTRRPQGRILDQAAMASLLEAASNFQRRGWHDVHRLQLTCMVHVLRDSGFRASELLAMRLGNVKLTDEGGGYLSLPENGPDLKTGPRTIAVANCVPALKAWMAAHPAAGDAKAPLWPRVQSRDGQEAMRYTYLADVIKALGEVSGVNASVSRSKPLTCHDFRHTRATEAANRNWHPTKMEAFFGWGAGSKMASRYAHLAQSDLMDQVLRDAGIDRTCQRQEAAKPDAAKELLDLLKQALKD